MISDFCDTLIVPYVARSALTLGRMAGTRYREDAIRCLHMQMFPAIDRGCEENVKRK